MSKKLQKKIEKKLEKLHELLANLTEAQVIDPNDPDTWDSDALYDLAANLQATLQLLEDQKGKQLDEFGQPLYEEGLCSLVDSYQSEEEEEDY